MELISTNGKRDFGTKFTGAEFCLPFAQTMMNRDRFAHVNGKQPTNNMLSFKAGTKVGSDQLGPPVRVGSTRIDSDQLGLNKKKQK